ncbi:sugar transporter ERD6-like 7 [Brassica napus]|uniref:sugar transporter ERD6-like 7 n=1 Tax=Brassica napus TaxID=3708 RepID=UPI0006AB1161|nr:sugar transporter ERD6-like 7 [Brassica napus]
MAESKPKQPWMVNLSTFVVVCGSLAFGSCPGYSSPAQAAIRNDLFLTIAEGVVALDLGRLATGYGMGAFSYVLSPSRQVPKLIFLLVVQLRSTLLLILEILC